MAVKLLGGVGLAQLVKRVKADRALKDGEVTPAKVGNKQELRAQMGLGNTLGAVPIANGGTGVTTVEALRGVVLEYAPDDELIAYLEIET